jgi:hypothetical protein
MFAGFGWTANATTVVVALPLEPLAESVAETVTTPGIVPAVNNPALLITPEEDGVIDQVTFGSLDVNCCCCPAITVADEGLSAGGRTVTVTVAVAIPPIPLAVAV